MGKSLKAPSHRLSKQQDEWGLSREHCDHPPSEQKRKRTYQHLTDAKLLNGTICKVAALTDPVVRIAFSRTALVMRVTVGRGKVK